MRHVKLPNGDIKIMANNEERSDLSQAYRENGYHGAEMLVSEGLHEILTFIRPEMIGALTDAPILTDDADYSDEVMKRGGPAPYKDADVWWFPDYAIRDPWQELAYHGRVVFTLAKSE